MCRRGCSHRRRRAKYDAVVGILDAVRQVGAPRRNLLDLRVEIDGQAPRPQGINKDPMALAEPLVSHVAPPIRLSRPPANCTDRLVG